MQTTQNNSTTEGIVEKRVSIIN